MRKTVAILGMPIDDLDSAQALDRIEEFIRSGRFHQVATANTDFLVKAQHDPELSAILRAADMVVADGMPLVLASRWLRVGLPERVTGSDMVPRLAARAAEKGYRLFMLGAKPDVARRAKERMEAAYPGLQIVGCVSPPLASIVEMDNAALLAEIEAARPDILLVAFGNPKQEKWIHMHRRCLRVPVCIGVGGTFDFLAGTLARAPVWMQRAGLEWLHRLGQEPRRMWRRYGADLVHFVHLIGVQLWMMRRREGGEHSLATASAGDCTVLSVTGALGPRLLPEFAFVASEALDAPSHLVLDLNAATCLDSAALGLLLNLPKRAAYVGREVRIVCAGRRIRRILRAARVDGLLRCYPTLAEALHGEAGDAAQARLSVREATAILILCGRADLNAVACVEATLRDLPPEAQQVTIDARGVTYIDSAMLAVLRRLSVAVQQAGGRVCLLPGRVVTETLAREKLQTVFEVSGREI